jgi:hypothetical protein
MTATTTFARYILKIIKIRSYVLHDDTNLTSNIIDVAFNKTRSQIKEYVCYRALGYSIF